MNKYLLFFRFTDFLRSSRYFSSIVISINFYHVECGDGRQPRILVDNFWIPRSKTRTFFTPGFLTEPCYYHRWPKRNMGLWWRNMRVCMGKREFEYFYIIWPDSVIIREKVGQNRSIDLNVPLCRFGGVKCQCVCFFAWNLELILGSFEDRSSDSVLPCLLLLHCQVRWCKSTQIALKLRKNKDNDSR